MLSENFESNKSSNKVLHESELCMPLNLADNKYLRPVKYIRVIPTFCSMQQCRKLLKECSN